MKAAREPPADLNQKLLVKQLKLDKPSQPPPHHHA